MSEFTPLERLQFVVDGIPNDEERYHRTVIGDDPEMQDAVAELQRWARAAFASATVLQPSRGVEELNLFGYDFDVADVTQFAKGRGVFIRALESEIAPAGMKRMAGAPHRVVDLLDRLVEVKLPVTASAYLFQAAQLYIWGFDAQVFAMARAVLEAALKDRMPAEQVYGRRGAPVEWIKRGSKREVREPTLEERIVAVEAKPSSLRADIIHAMRMIKADGNDILHTKADPGVTRHGNALDALASLASVLHALYADPGSRGGRL